MESEEALRHYANLFRAFQKEQFFFAVGNNAIAPNEIGAYLVQDAHYLEALRDRLRDLAQLVEDPGAQSVLRQHSRDAEGLPAVARTIVERDLRLPELLHEGPDSTTRGYIDHQRQSVCSGGREGILSILPCYLFYPFFVRAIRSKVLDSEILQKCLPFISTEQQARRWVQQILGVGKHFGLANPLEEGETPFVRSARYEAAMLDMAMKRKTLDCLRGN